jgi:hypothetical protein
MKTLEHQLTALGMYLDGDNGPIAPDEILSGYFETATSSQPRTRWWVAVVVAAAELVLIGGTTWILRGDAVQVADEPAATITVTPEVTVTTEMPPPTTAAPPVTSDAPAVPVAPSSWTRIDVGDLVGGTVATGPMGMVAMGTNTELSGTSWFSADGEIWKRLAVPQGMDVAYGDPGFVICCHDTGRNGDFLSREGSSFSTNGIDWSTTQVDFDGNDQRQPGTYLSMDTVTFGNGKFVALGKSSRSMTGSKQRSIPLGCGTRTTARTGQPRTGRPCLRTTWRASLHRTAGTSTSHSATRGSWPWELGHGTLRTERTGYAPKGHASATTGVGGPLSPT